MKTSFLSPLTPEQSRAARRELALSQKDVIAATGVQSYKLKQFEAGNFRPDLATLKKLREFYEESGINFGELDAHIAPAKLDDQAALKPGYTSTPRPGFFISNDLPADVVDGLMSDMEASDDRIAEIVKASIKAGVFGGLSDEAEQTVRELFGHLAANHLRFRFLQGRNIIEPARDEAEAKTVGDYLSQWARGKGIAHVAPQADTSANSDHEAATAEQE